MSCPEVQELIQRWIDGAAPPPEEGEAAEHLAACPSCRRLLRAARLMNEGLARSVLPLPPERLSRRIEQRLLSEARRQLRIRRLAAAAALAASLVVGVTTLAFVFRPSARSTTVASKAANPALVPSLHQQVEEASEAVVSLTERAARKTADESRLFFPAVAPPALSENQVVLQTLSPSSQSLEEIKRGMRAGLEPVTDSARRALDLFLGEIPQKEANQRPGS
jgi:hypothetical protein